MTDNEKTRKQKILVADDSEINRSILADMLGDGFEVVEAEDGLQAVAAIQKYGTELSLLLLDITMPKMDGFEVLEMMNRSHWIEDIPVIVISAESSATCVRQAYELGVTDFISRPFDALIVRRRVLNTIMLYVKQKRLTGMVAEQIQAREKSSDLMISILSHIVEFRNGESGMHVLHIRTVTELLLRHLMQKSDRYQLTADDISLISTASALHDVGKIAIPDEILNKPGKLTPEEYRQMQEHSLIGAEMLEKLPFYQNEPLVKTAYQICRWHHERYDGKGYPDGLSGEDIPIAAQIVSLADVYDALTSQRVYKAARDHQTAMDMIQRGECGCFNPLLLECLAEISDTLRQELENGTLGKTRWEHAHDPAAELLAPQEELPASDRTLHLLEYERMKYRFFASMSQEIQFEYTNSPPMLAISDWGARKLGLSEILMDPFQDKGLMTILGRESLTALTTALHASTPEDPVVQLECPLRINGQLRWHRIICRATWEALDPPKYLGAIGKASDIHQEYLQLLDLRHMASHDGLTGLLNHVNARQRILDLFAKNPNGNYAMALLDLDHFKTANDSHGHAFGDRVLQYVASVMAQSIRKGDIAARVGGDEFMIFFSYQTESVGIIQRLFETLSGQFEDFPISISMGIARTRTAGYDYDVLFHRADQALYAAKRAGRKRYCFYDDTMRDSLSVLSPIDQ